MNIITLDNKNIAAEHICCAISKETDCQVQSKKKWLCERFVDGLVFKKCDVRGKCFIEYIPCEKAWAPVIAAEFMYINCLWVSGKFAASGYSTLLLDACIADSKQKGKKGLVILSSDKKRPFIADSKFLLHKGFKLADTAPPYFQLFYLPFEENVQMPQFAPQAKKPYEKEKGFVFYYTSQCPFNAKYIPLIEDVCEKHKIPFATNKIASCEQAQASCTPFTTYSVFYNGKFLTHEQFSPPKFEKLLAEKGLI